MKTTRVALLAALAGASLLSGCAMTSPFGIEEFDRQQAASDALPPAVLGTSDVDPSSSRLLENEDGVRYFAARHADDICLVMYASDSEWAAGCSGNLPIEVGIAGHPDAQLLPSPLESPQWESLGDHISRETTP
jgi:hypothetical protein